MATYTGFRFNLTLRADTPQETMEVLQYLANHELSAEDELASRIKYGSIRHPFFISQKWYLIFSPNSNIEFMEKDGTAHSGRCTLAQSPNDGTWRLLASSCSTGAPQNAALLLDWLMPYLITDTGEVLASARYEEDWDQYSDIKTQYWIEEGKVVKRSLSGCVSDPEWPERVVLPHEDALTGRPVNFRFYARERSELHIQTVGNYMLAAYLLGKGHSEEELFEKKLEKPTSTVVRR